MDNTFHLQFPFTKIDKEKRIVVGIATADNVDKADDIVDYDASVEAFANWVGNIREMHGPKAVGKALSYTPVEVSDQDGNLYRGIQVEAYVSKGAEDTWQKVLDGTLTGFSIGGMVGDVKKEFHSKLNKMVRRITKYALGELSLVDNPCNPVSQISVVKNTNGTLIYEFDEEIEKAESYSPPDGVRAEARRALEWMKEGEAGGGFTSVGRRRASQLANGQAVSLSTIKRMASYLARHQVDKKGKGWSPGEEGYPSPGRVAWAAWGGDAAVSWTNKILRSAENIEKIARPELEYVDSLLEIVEEYGKLADNDGKGIWVGYVSAENNADAEIGVACKNCYFYDGEGVCAIISQSVEDNGVCRLAAINDACVHSPDDNNMNMINEVYQKLITKESNMNKGAFTPTPVSPSADTDFAVLLGRFRALSFFYQQAHWAASGTTYYGDHLLFERLYDEVSSVIDEIAEKGIGATGSIDHVSLDTQVIALYSFTKDMQQAPASNLEFAKNALDFEESLAVWLTEAYNDESNVGIQNMLQGFIDSGISRIYLLRRLLNDTSTGEDDQVGMPLMRAADGNEVYFCESCSIATQKDTHCSACGASMILIGKVEDFNYNNVAKMISTYVHDLQKNSENANITNMNKSSDSTTISNAAAELMAKVASTVVPQFHLFSNDSTDEHDAIVKSEESTEVEEVSEEGNDDSGGDLEVNTEELLKSLSEMIDGRLNEFKEQIVATVDEKVEAVVKSVEVSDVDTESLEKSEEVVDDEKDALIKSLTDRIDKLESTGAVKKSLDEDVSDEEVITKSTSTSIWEGVFVPLEVVHALGYES